MMIRLCTALAILVACTDDAPPHRRAATPTQAEVAQQLLRIEATHAELETELTRIKAGRSSR